MKSSVLTHKNLLVFVLTVAMVVSFLPVKIARHVAAWPRDFVAAAIAPLTQPLRKVGNAIRGESSFVQVGFPINAQAITTQESYLELIAYTRQLQEQLNQARQIITQLGELRRVVIDGVRLLPAEVIAYQSDTNIERLTINRGKNHGIVEGMPVANGAHLVGRISFAGAKTSTVKLITSPGTRLVVRTASPIMPVSQHEALLQLIVGHDANRGVFVARGDQGDPIVAGDLAHLVDDRWPSSAMGLIVGKVLSIEPDAKTPLLRTQVRIVPMYPLSRLNQVLVILPEEVSP